MVVKIELIVLVLGFLGLFLAGIVTLIIIARTTGISSKRIDHRQQFFKLVEEAREAEILEKKPVTYDVSGTWKGEGDGYFGVGRNLDIELSQEQSSLSGRLTDHFGYSEIRGFFVWPYLWFDFERHGTIFEFRGIIKESTEGTSIAGKYRYFHDDADWTVKRIGKETAHKAQTTASEATSVKKPKQVPVKAPGTTDGAARPTKTKEAKDPALVPVTPKTREEAGPCPDCGNLLEEIFSFCIHCGKKRE